MTKVNEKNWPQLDFLINNFYEIVEYKRGKGVYGDRVILKRPKSVKAILGEPDKLYSFYYLDANPVKEFAMTILEKLKFIVRFVTSPEDMNVLCNFESSNGVPPEEWAIETRSAIFGAKTVDFSKLNQILLDRYKTLDSNFITLLNKHRQQQYFLASSDEFNFITKEHADEQLALL